MYKMDFDRLFALKWGFENDTGFTKNLINEKGQMFTSNKLQQSVVKIPLK